MEQTLSTFTLVLLSGLVLAVMLLPFLVHKVEQELEIFLLVCGLCAVTVSHAWSGHLVLEALKEPWMITSAVLILGLLFKKFGHYTGHVIYAVEKRAGPRIFLFLAVFGLGLFSSVLTAIIAALLAAEIIKLLNLPSPEKTRLAIYTCFSIGFGAVLTPIGEPLSTIVVAKLKDAPYYANFFFLMKLLGWWILPGLVLFGLLAMRMGKKSVTVQPAETAPGETYTTILVRAGKVYLFVAGLVLLGEGLKPLAMRTILHLSKYALYWLNTLSAVLDNATVASIAVTPDLPRDILLFLLISLVCAGGLLIPGNIPNIICAAKLDIKTRAWAKAALPLGIMLMAVYFIVLCIV